MDDFYLWTRANGRGWLATLVMLTVEPRHNGGKKRLCRPGGGVQLAAQNSSELLNAADAEL